MMRPADRDAVRRLREAVVRHHDDTAAHGLRPDWTADSVPLCNAECPVHDGKRCRALGLRPSGVCEPAVEALARLALHGVR